MEGGHKHCSIVKLNNDLFPEEVAHTCNKEKDGEAGGGGVGEAGGGRRRGRRDELHVARRVLAARCGEWKIN